MQLGQYPDPVHTVAHLSDTHLLADGKRQYDVVDPERGLLLALERIARIRPVPDAIVVTGDLADLGEPAAYARVKELVEPAAAAIGAQVVWVMGNHDERLAYSKELFGAATDTSQDAVHDVGGLRIVSLDSSVPGYHHGELSAEQLAWLGEVLATPAPHGTLLALHHPPVPTPMVPAEAVLELADQHLLADVLRGSDVRSILAGHLHFSTYSTFAGIPVSVASASCYTLDPAPTSALLRGVDGGGAISMTHLYEDRVVHTVVPLDEAPEVYSIRAELAEDLAALSPEQRRELLSRKDAGFDVTGAG
ncbi:3',5'-cyclic AMP phosphodiesterase CpdA [Nocardioides terrae]|uniref:3',5'-cyclic AMP phosphodiesterase CpdA n=1 Tax=Nocardioides terrae TaxID=574651 RepID=A0A1I1KHB9_9ACTN|nr:metallophosphoesterase [Nocardioides terrae]SFC59672.1 3',5'-cyclic AMP phosphodiesterase CpdA [Nocardioides terrae]